MIGKRAVRANYTGGGDPSKDAYKSLPHIVTIISHMEGSNLVIGGTTGSSSRGILLFDHTSPGSSSVVTNMGLGFSIKGLCGSQLIGNYYAGNNNGTLDERSPTNLAVLKSISPGIGPNIQSLNEKAGTNFLVCVGN